MTPTKGSTGTRALALAVLRRLELGSATLDDLLAAPECEALDARERAFLHELVLGSLRQRGSLDHALLPLLDRPLERVDAVVRDILRLGAYQILHLRVPDRAAVSESVELARTNAPPAAGFVNAVLRRLARDGAPTPPDAAQDPLKWLTSVGSLPAWLAQRWLSRLGPQVSVARAQTQLQPAPTAFRLNPRCVDASDQLIQARVEMQPLAVPGAYVASAGDLHALHRRHVIYLQDAGSQAVARLAAEGGGPFLDACAAPGGKSTLIADLQPQELVVAAELSRRRCERLTRLAGAWGATNVRIVSANALQPPFARPFATVLLDAPCSGLGTLARHPDIRWRARAEDLARHATRQRDLLASLAALVGRSGRLVYSVCSLEPEETSNVVAEFCARHTDFEPIPPPDWAARFADGNALTLLPERDGGDGFFATVFRRH